MRTVIGLYFELCLDEARRSPGYEELVFDKVNRCSFDTRRGGGIRTFGKHCAS